MKKNQLTSKDKKDWTSFTKNLENIHDKDNNIGKKNIKKDRIRKLDLHGLSLDQANKNVKEFIIQSFENGYKKLLVITGKGLRSQVHKNPYLSENMNILRNSVPEFINNNEDLLNKINKITEANPKDGGRGAFYIFLRNKKNL